jgi:epidermal growth factor receptor
MPLSDKEKLKEFHQDIINEATLMASVNHEHCLKLSGLCLVEPVRMVFRLMRYGSVVQFYQKHRNRVTEEMLLKWAEQIAEGMNYLETRGIVHRDLAARNILIKKFDHIVITDFGLAKMLDSSEKGYLAKKNSLLPIKWMAIESIQDRLFTHKSDVWSYGVIIYI